MVRTFFIYAASFFAAYGFFSGFVAYFRLLFTCGIVTKSVLVVLPIVAVSALDFLVKKYDETI